MPLWLDIAAKVATMIAVLIALSPHLRKAWRLLIYYPRVTEGKRRELIGLRYSDRMGVGQKAWVDFLHWCRTKDPDLLTWKERRARWWWCPLLGHDIVERYRPADDYQGVCGNCRGSIVTDSDEGLDRWARSGASPHVTQDVRVRRRQPRRRRIVAKNRR